MKLLSILYFSFCFIEADAQLKTNVVWTDETSFPVSETLSYKRGINLLWKDFRGDVPDESRAAAMTVSGFGYKANLKTTNGKGGLNISVYCYFDNIKSWVKKGSTSIYILNHEQHHFDISYLAAKLFIDKLESTVFTNSNYNVLLPKIYNECGNIMNKMQNDYDGQTKNGQLKDMQAKWNDLLEQKISMIIK